MAGLRMTKKSFILKNGKKHHGFTMVELIVVIAIIAILAGVGIIAAVGYVNRTKFDQNSQNAITIYQTAQAALSQKSMNGTIDSWVQGLSTAKNQQIFDQDLEKQLRDDEEADHSISKNIALTYNPNSASVAEDAYVYDLLSSYFYDRAVFAKGTISLELCITATYGNGKINYSARVLSAFYSKENSSNSGWDNTRIGKGYIPNDSEFKMLPEAKGDDGYKYRRTTSYVGWFNGTSESITAPVGVLPVFLPPSQIEPLEGHIVAGDETGYLFNLRNGETLDASWAIFDFDGTEHKDHNEDIYIILSSASYGNDTTDSNFHDGIRLEISQDALDTFLNSVKNKTTTVTKENINNVYDVTRTSQDGFVQVTVIRTDSGSDVSLGLQTFPLTITKVEGDGRKGTSRDKDGNLAPYYEFRLSLDCIMVRDDEAGDSGWNHYSIDRLFGHSTENRNNTYYNRANPRNIYAAMYGMWEYTNASGNEVGFSVSSTTPTIAARAMDDPVYWTSTKRANADLTYYYYVEFNSVQVPGKGRFDDDDSMDDINNKVITGRCVVNTLFGDRNYDGVTDKTKSDAIGGTFWDASGGNAVITSYRHLYNIRKIHSEKIATFRIVSNLDWYAHDKVSINGTETDLYTSEVKVFGQGTAGYKSPVMDNKLKIVSFPALNELLSKQTLTSMSKGNGTVYSINNVQLRSASFRQSDPAYGLICKNSGTIFNIYTNNLNLVLATKSDGSDSDYASISSGSSVGYSTGAVNPIDGGKGHPVGGLIGTNFAVIGKSGLEDNLNTIRMNNTIVMSGSYWKANTLCNEVGGVIGLYGAGSSNGVIEIRGSFAVVSGGKNTAGIIGDAKVDIGARLVVDGNTDKKAPSEFVLPTNSVTNQKMACVVSGRGNVAGAVAWFEKHELTYDTSKEVASDDLSIDEATGKITFPDLGDDAYHIDVTLPKNSLIIKNGTYDDNNDTADNPRRPIGGAIGRWTECTGDYASIRIDNDGYIIATNNSKNVLCGGAVGREDNSSITTVYIEVNNRENSRIGNVSNTTGPVASGGAYGRIDGARAGTLLINVKNDGVIVSRGSGNGLGTGGAIGGVYSNVKTKYFINVINDDNSEIISTGTVGGAIGGMYNSNTVILQGSVISSTNYNSISGKNNTGGTIGNASETEGKIYSVLYDATISGEGFVGGAAGRVQGLRTDGDAFVRTIIKSNSSVTGSGSIVGGVVGDVNISGDGSNSFIELKGDGSVPVLTVNGADGIGGVAGVMRSNSANHARVISPDQSAANKLITQISGNNNVGGVIGKLRSASVSSTKTSEVLNNDSSSSDISVVISVVLNPQSSISGSGSSVGGAVGSVASNEGVFNGYISVGSSVGSANEGSIIKGKSSVGGAVGQIYKTYPSDSSAAAAISVDFSKSSWTIKSTNASGNDANVGGAVGFFNNDKDVADNKKYSTTGVSGNKFPITVNLGSSSIEADGNNVGGAIGKNLVRNGIINVTSNGSVNGGSYVGGAIGVNRAEVNKISVNILGQGQIWGKDKKIGDQTVIDDNTGVNINAGSNVGGAVGFNYSPITDVIDVVINGKVIGAGSNVGGAIGFCYAVNNQKENNSLIWVNNIVVTLQGNARVESEADCVGGALGYTLGNINNVQAIINGNSKISGKIRVGGVIGFATSAKNVAGATVMTQGPGIVNKAEVIISADEALVGNSKIGGVVGEAGYKKYVGTADNWTAPRFETMRAEINAAKLFDTDNTGVEKDEDAMVGGVVGRYCDGTCGEIILGGTGGVVELNDENLNYPRRTYNHAILIQANGRSIGGIVGLIGTDQYHQNVYLSNISVEENGPYLCVVSGNGADRIGGWIGSGNGDGGGLGYRFVADWNNREATYQVDKVKVVYSEGSYVGGLIGYMDAYGRNNTNDPNSNIKYDDIHTWANVIVNLDGATIMGKSCVGGAIGGLGYTRWLKGKLEVHCTNYTNIGDIGNPLPGDDTEYNHICYEAGGAVGYVYGKSTRNNQIYIPITVTFDKTSRVCGLASQETDELSKYGVGGVFGRSSYCYFQDSSAVHLTTDPSVVSVYSENTSVGGFAGVMESGSLYLKPTPRTVNFFSTDANVKTNGKSACAGGFIGRLEGGSVKYSRASGKVISNGNASNAGGFIGAINSTAETTVDSCFTTSTVESKGLCAGGFVGVVDCNDQNITIQNSYVGGHTYDGQYVANEGNISGTSNVGGFIGANNGTGNLTINNCYSTASVFGTGENIGGFIGSMDDSGIIKASYSAGRVEGTNANTVGAFAGHLSVVSNDRLGNGSNINKALTGVNGGGLLLVGSVGEDIKQDSDVATWIVFNNERGIRGKDATCDGFPTDETLITDSANGKGKFTLKPVMNNAHYGDWPLPVTDRISVANAVIAWDQDKVQFDENGKPVFVYGSNVGIDTIKQLLSVQVEGIGLTYDDDYTLKIEDNINVGTASVIISGKGAYVGSVKTSFIIVPMDIQDVEGVQTTIVEIDPDQYPYTGAGVEPILTVSIKITKDGVETIIPLTKTKDYYLTYEHLGLGDASNVKPGEVVVTVHGTGNYTGVADKPEQKRHFIIKALDLANAEVTVINKDNLVYTGTYIEPDVVVRLDNRNLIKDQDYTVTYDNNVDAGDNTAIVTVTSVEGSNYEGHKDATFTIKSAKNTWVEKPSIVGWVYGNPAEPYGEHADGTNLKVTYYIDSSCTIKTNEANSGTKDGDGGKPVNVGTYYMEAEPVLTPNGNSIVDEGIVFYNHTNDLEADIKSFTITQADISSASVNCPAIYHWTGTEIKPDDEIVVTYGDDPDQLTLVLGTDYRINYPANTTDVGTVSFTVEGIGNYTGTNTGSYAIERYHTVTFSIIDDQGVVTPVRTPDVPDGDCAEEPQDIEVPEGYILDGWYVDETCSQKYDFTIPITSDNVVIYAKYKPDDSGNDGETGNDGENGNENNETEP